MWLTAVGLLILLQFWWLPGSPGTPDDSYSAAVGGKRGLYETLKVLSGDGLIAPVRRETDEFIPDDASTLLIIGPDRSPDEREERELASFVANGGRLLITPGWSVPGLNITALGVQTHDGGFSEDSDEPVELPPATVPPEPADSTDQPQLTAEAEEDSTVPPEAARTPPSNEADDEVRSTENQSEAERVVRERSRVPTAVESGNASELRVASVQVTSPLMPDSVSWRTRAALSVTQPTAEVLVVTAQGVTQAASWSYGNGRVLVSASPDVFSNSSFLFPESAELAIRLIEHAHGSQPTDSDGLIVVSEYLNASDKYHGTAVLVSPSLRSGTLQLILTALLIGWFGFHRFGPVKHKTTLQRRSLEESATAVGNLQFRSGGGAEVVRSYLEYMAVQMRKRFGTSLRLEDAAGISARTGLPREEVATAIQNATQLSSSSSTSNSAAGAAVRQLSEILDRLTG